MDIDHRVHTINRNRKDFGELILSVKATNRGSFITYLLQLNWLSFQ
jgi:hypothetical protein